MKYLKLYEEYDIEPQGLVSVPSDFEDRLRMAGEEAKRKQEVYSVPKNQLRIDLWYNLKDAIFHYLQDAEGGWVDKTQEEYENRLNKEIDGSLYKFSISKYNNIAESDTEKVRSILWKYINDILPFDKVSYHYTYGLDKKLMKLTEDFVNEIVEKDLFI